MKMIRDASPSFTRRYTSSSYPESFNEISANLRNLCSNLGTSRILQKRREGCCCRCRSCCCRCCPGEAPEAPRTLMTEESSKTFSGDRVNSSVTWSVITRGLWRSVTRNTLRWYWAGERRIGWVIPNITWHNHSTGTPGHKSQRCSSYVTWKCRRINKHCIGTVIFWLHKLRLIISSLKVLQNHGVSFWD